MEPEYGGILDVYFTLTRISPAQRLHLYRLKQLSSRISPTHFSRIRNVGLEKVLLASCTVACVYRGGRLVCLYSHLARSIPTLSVFRLQSRPLSSLPPLIKLKRMSSYELVDNNFPPHSSDLCMTLENKARARNMEEIRPPQHRPTPWGGTRRTFRV